MFSKSSASGASSCVEVAAITWTRSSRCAADSPQCVEVAAVAPDTVLIRDSKNPDQANVQIYSRAEWNAFLAGVAHGDFAHI
jgi:hypothetical protein